MLLFFTAMKAMAADYNVVTCFFGARPLEAGSKVIEKEGAKFVNLRFLNNYLHIISKWEPDNGMVELQFGSLNMVLNEDMVKYTQNKESKQLSQAPFRWDEQLWIPLDFLFPLGIMIKKEESSILCLDWAEDYLLQIEEIKYQKRPAFLLIGSKTLNIKNSSLIVNPDRLLIDLSELKLHPAINNNILGNSNVKKVRLGQRDAHTVRLVFDLAILNGYQIVKDPQQEQQLIIVFNYFVQGVNFFQQGNVRKVQINTSLPAQYKVSTLVNPQRLYIDLEGATLNTASTKINGDGRWVKGIRIAQFDPHTVRVVLDIYDTIPCYVTRSAENPNLVEVRTIQTITKIDWKEEANKLIITGDGELEDTITKSKTSKQLQIDLNYFQLKPGLMPPKIKSNLVDGIQITPISLTTIRVEVSLKEYVIYETDHLKNNQLIISFKPSVLKGETIVLDAGHGGVDPGACGSQGTREKDCTLDVTMRLKDMLEDVGVNVVLTRIDDSYIGLFERPMIANFVLADIFISIHCNSFAKDSKVRGIEVYYYQGRNDSKSLADVVLERLVFYTGLNKRSVKVNDNYIVLKESQMTSILIELGYLSNFEEETLLEDDEFRDKAATGIFKGLVAYYQK